MTSKKLKFSYLHPKYWLTWLVIGISWLLASLPRSWQYGLSNWLANRFASKEGRRINTIRRNIDACFPEKSDQDRRQLIRGNLKSSVLMLFDLLNMIWREPKDMTSTVRIVGLEHLEQVLAANEPLLLVTGHFTPLFQLIAKLTLISPFRGTSPRFFN